MHVPAWMLWLVQQRTNAIVKAAALCGTSIHDMQHYCLGSHPAAIVVQAVEGEAENMVLVPCWQDEDPNDRCIPLLVDALLAAVTPLAPEGDVRQHSAAVTQHIARALASQPADSAAEQQNDEAMTVSQTGTIW